MKGNCFAKLEVLTLRETERNQSDETDFLLLANCLNPCPRQYCADLGQENGDEILHQESDLHALFDGKMEDSWTLWTNPTRQLALVRLQLKSDVLSTFLGAYL